MAFKISTTLSYEQLILPSFPGLIGNRFNNTLQSTSSNTSETFSSIDSTFKGPGGISSSGWTVGLNLWAILCSI